MSEAVVEWTYGNQLPDVIEIKYTPDGSTGPYDIAELRVRGFGNPSELAAELAVRPRFAPRGSRLAAITGLRFR